MLQKIMVLAPLSAARPLAAFRSAASVAVWRASGSPVTGTYTVRKDWGTLCAPVACSSFTPCNPGGTDKVVSRDWRTRNPTHHSRRRVHYEQQTRPHYAARDVSYTRTGLCRLQSPLHSLTHSLTPLYLTLLCSISLSLPQTLTSQGKRATDRKQQLGD